MNAKCESMNALNPFALRLFVLRFLTCPVVFLHPCPVFAHYATPTQAIFLYHSLSLAQRWTASLEIGAPGAPAV